MVVVHNSGLSRRWAVAAIVLPTATLIAYLVGNTLLSLSGPAAVALDAVDWIAIGSASVISVGLVALVFSGLSIRIGTVGVSRWTFTGWATLTWAEITRAGRQGSGIVFEGSHCRLGFVPSVTFDNPTEVEQYIKEFLPRTEECEL
jgi:hypothetical protein